MKKVGKVDPCVTKVMYSVQDYSVLYNKAFLHVRKSNQHGDGMELVIGSTCKSAPISNSYFVLRAIPSQLFDVCRGNNELFLVPWNKTLKYLNYFLLGFHSKV